MPDYDALADQIAQTKGQALQAPTAAAPVLVGGTDYDALADQIVGMRKSAAMGNILAGQGSNPDQVAKANAISKQVGIPQPAVENNLPDFEQRVQLANNKQVIDDHPGVAAWTGENPLGARMAMDDFNKLGFIEKTFDALKSGVSGAILQNEMGRLGNAKQVAGLTGAQTPDTDQQIQGIQQQLSVQPALTGGFGFVKNFTGFMSGLVDNAVHGATAGALGGAAVGAAAGSIFGGVGAGPGALAGARTGAMIGFNADMSLVAAGNAYLKMNTMRGSDGQALSEPAKQFGSIFTGAATYAIGSYAGALEGKLFGQTADSLVQKALTEAVTRPTFAAAITNFASQTAKGAAQGAGIMTAMEGSSIIGEEIAKTMSEGHFDTDKDEIVSRLADAAVNGAVMLGAMHGTMHGLGLYGDLRAAQRSEANMQLFQNLQDGAVDSKLRSRDQQAFQDFMQKQTEGSPVENLYIPAEKIREFYQSMKIDPDQADRTQDPLFGFVKDMPDQLREAAESGGDVVIPTADYLTHLAGTPIAEKMLPDLRVGADAMSVNEAKNFSQEYQRQIKDQVDQASSVKPDSTQQIFEDVRKQATDAGYSDVMAKQSASVFAARYAARGERLGEDPIDIYKATGLTIKKGEPGDIGKGLQQTTGEQPRGSIRFEDGQKVISLFKDANASTLIHEGSHAWLEELIHDATLDAAPKQLKDDLASTLKWLGVEDHGNIGVEQHEQFARAGEAYLMEGKAPSNALAIVFSRFKTWLTKLYGSVKALDTPINDELRGVFDRLLATDQEIADAKKAQGLEPAFRDRESAGMTSAEWKSYLGMIDKANQTAESTMLEKMMAKVRRQRTKEYKEEKAALHDEVAAEIDKRPDIQALNLLTKNILPDGTKAEQPYKLSRDQITKDYGKETVTDLPKGSTAKDGMHPADVSEMLGFKSPDDMITALKNLERQQREIRLQEGEKRGIRQYLIDQATDQKIDAKHGDLMDEVSIKQEALSAIHSDKQAELLATELRYLKRMGAQALIEKGKGRKAVAEEKAKSDWDAAALDLVGKLAQAKDQAKIDEIKQQMADLQMSNRWNEAESNTTQAKLEEAIYVSKPMLDAVRAHVDTVLQGKTVDEIGKFNQYARAERKAGREVQQAILKKDWEAAAAAKQRQILNNILYAKAKFESDGVDKSIALMERLAAKRSFKGIDQGFTDQIHALLERFGIRTAREGEELMRGLNEKSLADFTEEQFARGNELPITPFLESAGGEVRELKLSSFNELDGMIRSLQALGRNEQNITIGDTTMEKTWAVAEMVTALGELKQREKSNFYRPEDAGILAEKKAAAGSFLRSLDAALLKPEQLFDWMDGNNPDGPFNRFIFRPLKEASHLKNRMLHNMVETTFREAKRVMPKEWMGHMDDRVETGLINPDTGDAFQFNRKRMLSIALNWGTEDNATKLADGYKWSPRDVQSFLDKNMTKDDWNFVQHLWAGFDKMGPQLDELQRRVSGTGIEFVQGRSIDTPFGKIEGKYFPLVYDATKSVVAERNLERSSTSLFEGQYPRATTRNGSVITRVQGVKQPIELSLDIIPFKMGQTIHDIAFREAIMNADKLLSDRDVIKAMDDSFGPEYRQLMRPWLQHVANSANINDKAMAFADRFLNRARANLVVASIGFRIGTMVKHGGSAFFNSAVELGPKWGIQGYKELFGTPQQMKRTWNWVMSMSDEMRFRKDQYDRDLPGNFENVIDPSMAKEGYQKLVEYSHMGVAILDMGSAVPLWIGAFRKGQSEGLSEADAISNADKTVRKAHGAQGITDKAMIQTSKSQLWKMTTMFYGFFNHIYNRQRDTARIAGDIPAKVKGGDFRGASNDFAKVLARTMGYVVMPGLATAYYSHGGPHEDKDEGWLGWASKAVLSEIPAGIPILRDIAKSAIEGRDYEFSPLMNTVNSTRKTALDIASLVGLREKDESPKTLKHAMETFGFLTGAPTGQGAAAAQFLWDVKSGDQDPQSLADWIQGLTYGKMKEE